MAKKSASKKKTPATKTKSKSATQTASKRQAKSVAKSSVSNDGAAAGACYVSVSHVSVVISRAKGKAGGAACQDFDAAKDAAIEGLIASIEAAEERLAACKRAATIDELSAS